MKSLGEYIIENYSEKGLKLSKKDLSILINLDRQYGKLMLQARYETVVREITNLDEEWEKFNRIYIHQNQKYFPILKFQKLKYKEYNIKERAEKLIIEFKRLDCYLSKFYIQNLEKVIDKCVYLDNIDHFQGDLSRKEAFNEDLLKKAFNIIEKGKKDLIEKEYQQNISGEEAKSIIKKELDRLGYDWEIIERPDMLPRMGVNPEKTFRINPNRKFSKIDIDNLIAHEVLAHTGKRYYGYQTGLFLFVFGLDGKNTLDEGLAIWNAMNLSKTPKPNQLFNIALSYIACYFCSIYDFCKAFDKLKELVGKYGVSDERIFHQLMRLKRSTIYTNRLGFWSGDIDYLKGYEVIRKMTDNERKDVLKYNVGPDSFHDIDTIKKFLKINKIPPLSNQELEKIKKNYPDL